MSETKAEYEFMGVVLRREGGVVGDPVLRWTAGHDSVPFAMVSESIEGRMYTAKWRYHYGAQGEDFAQGETPEQALENLGVMVRRLAKVHAWLLSVANSAP